MTSEITLHLYKQNFKFSAAHFMIFDAKNAERLHGHNYQVKLDIAVPPIKPERGYSVDFKAIKQIAMEILNSWDERVLLPELNQEMKFQVKGESLHVNFRERFYVFPVNEVALLPLTNTSVEQMSALLGQLFLKKFKPWNISKIRVRLEETRGQAASHVSST